MCVHATLNTYYVAEQRGYDDWERVASCPYFDVFSLTIINWSLPRSSFIDVTQRTVRLARKYGKQSERWIMNYNKAPERIEQMDEVIRLYADLGVDDPIPETYTEVIIENDFYAREEAQILRDACAILADEQEMKRRASRLEYLMNLVELAKQSS